MQEQSYNWEAAKINNPGKNIVFLALFIQNRQIIFFLECFGACAITMAWLREAPCSAVVIGSAYVSTMKWLISAAGYKNLLAKLWTRLHLLGMSHWQKIKWIPCLTTPRSTEMEKILRVGIPLNWRQTFICKKKQTLKWSVT